MNLSQPKLYSDLSYFEIGESDLPLSFSSRLGRENGWNSSFSVRAIEEYKKFIYLCCVSERELTPSDEVDQVWHLHLAYTHSYWIQMCRGIISKDLHHGPTKGGNKQSEKFKNQYIYTIELYKKEFETDPPRDIWPGVVQRFKDADKFIRINRSSFWLIKKPSQYIGPILLVPLLLAACTNDDGDTDIWHYLKIAIGIYVFYKIIQWIIRNSNGKGGGCGGAGCGGCGG